MSAMVNPWMVTCKLKVRGNIEDLSNFVQLLKKWQPGVEWSLNMEEMRDLWPERPLGDSKKYSWPAGSIWQPPGRKWFADWAFLLGPRQQLPKATLASWVRKRVLELLVDSWSYASSDERMDNLRWQLWLRMLRFPGSQQGVKRNAQLAKQRCQRQRLGDFPRVSFFWEAVLGSLWFTAKWNHKHTLKNTPYLGENMFTHTFQVIVHMTGIICKSQLSGHGLAMWQVSVLPIPLHASHTATLRSYQ